MLAYDALNIEHQFRDLRLRTFDLRKLVEGAGGKLDILRLQGTSVNKRLLVDRLMARTGEFQQPSSWQTIVNGLAK